MKIVGMRNGNDTIWDVYLDHKIPSNRPLCSLFGIGQLISFLNIELSEEQIKQMHEMSMIFVSIYIQGAPAHKGMWEFKTECSLACMRVSTKQYDNVLRAISIGLKLFEASVSECK